MESNLCEYEVEEILGFQSSEGEMKFFVKWKGWEHNDNSWVMYENMVNSVVFREYISNYYGSLEEEIFMTLIQIKKVLKEKIDHAMMQAKVMTMLDVLPFDPLELKVMQVFYHLATPDANYIEKLEDLTFRSFFFGLDQIQQRNIDEILALIHAEGDEDVTIENDEDFESPVEFTYITSNVIGSDCEVTSDEDEDGTGCDCKEGCSKLTACCPQKMKLMFAYKTDDKSRTIMRLEKTKKIVECCELCKCPDDCINRHTQLKKQVPLCLFMTKERGWGLKASTNISKGSFIVEFLGELITDEDAKTRGKTTYMFDLNSEGKMLGTIDAECFGNLSRFINHSCEPNTGTWLVNDCRDDPRNQRLW